MAIIMGDKQKILSVVFIILGFISLLRTTSLLWNSYLPDFSTRYDSGVLLSQHKNPYLNTHAFTPENYPPSALMLQLPFSLFSFPVASKIWLLISIFSFFISVALLYKIFPISFFRVAILILLSVIAFPFKFTLGMGQVNLIILFLLVFFLFLIMRKKGIFITIPLSLAIVIKLFPIGYFLPLIFKRQWKTVLAVLGVVLLLFFAPTFIFEKNISIYYFNNIFLPMIFGSGGKEYYNQSITGFGARLGVSEIIISLGRVFLLITSMFLLLKKKPELFLGFSFFTVLILLVNNFTWQHHLILLIIPYYFILKQKISKPLFFLTAFSYFLVAVNIKNPQFFSSAWYGSICLSHAFFGVFLLWVILAWNLKYD